MESKMSTQKNILIIVLLAVVCFVLAMLVYLQMRNQIRVTAPSQNGEVVQNLPSASPSQNFKPHPGTITIKNLYDGKETKLSVDAVPPSDQFVYFKNGAQVEGPEDADNREPIIRQEVLPISKKGVKTSFDTAATLRIQEYGEEGLLRERIVDLSENTASSPTQTPSEVK